VPLFSSSGSKLKCNSADESADVTLNNM
jgi:hypothetical protein